MDKPISEVETVKRYDSIMGATDWLRNQYGLEDNDTLTAAEVEELLQDYKDTREKELIDKAITSTREEMVEDLKYIDDTKMLTGEDGLEARFKKTLAKYSKK